MALLLSPLEAWARGEEETAQDHQFQVMMASIQALSESVHMILAQQQGQMHQEPPQQPQHEERQLGGELVAPPPPPVVADPMDGTSAAAHHKAFMSAKLPQFLSRKDPEKAEEWLEETEKAFEIMKIPDRLWVKFGTYMLIGDIKAWWTLLQIIYGGEELAWEEFAEQF